MEWWNHFIIKCLPLQVRYNACYQGICIWCQAGEQLSDSICRLVPHIGCHLLHGFSDNKIKTINNELLILTQLPSRVQLSTSIIYMHVIHYIILLLAIWPKFIAPFTRVIIDVTEIFVEAPALPKLLQMTFSPYKYHNTSMVLVGICPHGAVTFVSK